MLWWLKSWTTSATAFHFFPLFLFLCTYSLSYQPIKVISPTKGLCCWFNMLSWPEIADILQKLGPQKLTDDPTLADCLPSVSLGLDWAFYIYTEDRSSSTEYTMLQLRPHRWMPLILPNGKVSIWTVYLRWSMSDLFQFKEEFFTANVY